jgi:tetratricopeptide (TPR) repeat protein
MWTGQTPQKRGNGNLTMNWEDANGYCASLKIGDYSGWRLPTLNELKAISEYRRVDARPRQYTDCRGLEFMQCEFAKDSNAAQPAHETLEFKGGITVTYPLSVWSSTQDGDQQAYVVTPAGNWGDMYYYFAHGGGVISVGIAQTHANLLGLHAPPTFVSALCARPMEADLLQIAKDAQANEPVPDLLTLQASLPLRKARLAYEAGQFQDSAAQAQKALRIKPGFAAAYHALGIAYASMGQWDQAITNLKEALKIDKGYREAKTALKWAEDGKKNAKSEANPKA